MPDLQLLPQRYPTARTVEFRAALEFAFQTIGLGFLAALRRRGISLPVERWAKSLDRLASVWDRFGGPYGAMQVSVAGIRQDGAHERLTWDLTAPALNGPEVPCLAAILLARRLARGQLPERGAHPCMGFLSLGEFEPEFDRLGIRTQIGAA